MRNRPLIAVLAVVGLLSALPRAAVADAGTSPATAATAAPLKTIIEVRSTALCKTLRQGVQPTLAGLMQNDGLIEAANRGVVKLFDDQMAQADASGQMDRLYLRNVVSALAHNLDVIAQISNRAFPQDGTPAHASEADLRGRLQTIASTQNDALNLIEGFLQTEEIGRAQDEFVGGHQSGANEVAAGSMVKGQSLPNLDAQGFRAEFHNADDPTTPFVEKAGLGSGLYHPPRIPAKERGLPALIHLTRTRIADLEGAAGPAIIAAAKTCSAP